MQGIDNRAERSRHDPLAAQKSADSIDRTLDVLHRVGVGEADIAFALVAEAGARDQRDANLVQQSVLELARRVAGAAPARGSEPRATRCRKSRGRSPVKAWKAWVKAARLSKPTA